MSLEREKIGSTVCVCFKWKKWKAWARFPIWHSADNAIWFNFIYLSTSYMYLSKAAGMQWMCRSIPAVCSVFQWGQRSIETCTTDPKRWEPSASPSWHLLLEMTSVTVCRLSSPGWDWTLCFWIRIICWWNSGTSCSTSGSGGNGALLGLFQIYKLLQFYNEAVRIAFHSISARCYLDGQEQASPPVISRQDRSCFPQIGCFQGCNLERKCCFGEVFPLVSEQGSLCIVLWLIRYVC